tara:strand:+ start:27990 stop:28994 length:1005 start_codon:yes stop_codon:yes gene_type:complete
LNKDIYEINVNDFEVGKPKTEYVIFPSFYGMQRVRAPLYVYRATKEISPCVVVTACIHGDEINGMRIAQALMTEKFKLSQGTLIILPMVNIYGFFNKLRYLPDRKDLNRCFPGNMKGSFGSRFAHFIFQNITKYGDVFIDLHSGGPGRFNIPQIRCDLELSEVNSIIEDISIPLVANSTLRDGSLREAINDLKKPCIVFEGGEGLRVDPVITKYGVNLVKSILAHYDMISEAAEFNEDKFIIHKTKWIRAKQGGIFLSKSQYGKVVRKGEVLGEIRHMTGELATTIKMEKDGVILGMCSTALIMSGDALFNVGILGDTSIDDEEEFFDYFDFEM